MSVIEEALRRRKAAAAADGKRAAPLSAPGVAAANGAGKPPRELGDPARRKRVNTDTLRQAGLLPPVSGERALSHQFRSLKRPLIRAAFEAPADQGAAAGSSRSIMVSSALPGDGKTFTSLNLALSMALERDHSLILVDGDVAKPHLSKVFQADNEPGLLDVLEDPSRSIESVILPTDIPSLCIVPVGRQSVQATELLASARMRSVIRDLEALDPLGIVVVDSPPILLTSEARVLASLFAQVVMVVRAGGTPQQAVREALQLIGEGPKVNLVLNQALHAGDGGYYNYGYGRYGEEGVAEEQP
jgi:exopolysaccharide/PEP-CTERM locus tyrosine autokinase